jgi:hypothetical protein
MNKDSIEKLAQQIKSWREQKQFSRQKMPKKFWQDAVALANEFSRGEVVKTCKLDYTKLKGYQENHRSNHSMAVATNANKTNPKQKNASIDTPFINLSQILPDNSKDLDKISIIG